MALARRFMVTRAKGDVDALYEMLPPDFVSHATEEETGRKWDVPTMEVMPNGCSR